MTAPRDLIRPMLATAGELPTDPGWAHEFKWDGVRAITYVHRGDVRAMTRNDRDVTASYPELLLLPEQLGDTDAVLDGELVALDEAGRPNFGELQQRMHVAKPTPELLTKVPVGYLLFDVLVLDGTRLLHRPYDERRERLERLGLAGAAGFDSPPSFVDADGRDVLAAAESQGFEGVVAKRRDSLYEPGRRSRAWVKRPLIRTQEVVIGGWKPGEGRRSGTIGSLLLGVYADDGLRYVGHVGTGFNAATLAQLSALLRPLARSASPFTDEVPRDHARHARWAAPELVGEVEFRSWTRDGRLRHSSWRGLRPDKDPEDVR